MAREEAAPRVGVKDFETVTYEHTAAVSAGEVLELNPGLGLVGVAVSSYDADATGVYYVKGVFNLPIASGVTVSQYDRVWWDVSADEIIKDPAKADIYLGYAVADGTAAGGYVDVAINELRPASGQSSQSIVFQGDATLDLTDATSVATLASSGDLPDGLGGDVVIPVRVFAYVTTTVAADSTAPIITVQDAAGNSAGLTLTLTDGDAANDIATASLADGATTTAVDLTAEDLQVKVTTAAADAATAAGECKVLVECLLVN